MSLLAGISIGSFALDAYNSYQSNRKAKQARAKRASYFRNELQPLLDEATQEQDVDFDSIRDVEMTSVINRFQNQLKGITDQTNKIRSNSNLASNSFVDKNEMLAIDNAQDSFALGQFNVDKQIQTMQSQMDDMLNQNKLRAKELEYSYLYG